MDHALLVNLDLEKGAELVAVLDRAGLKPAVALWMFLPDYEDWRLILSGATFDAVDLKEAYGILRRTLAAADFAVETTPELMILPASDPMIKSLRRTFGKSKSVEGMRLGGQMIGDRFVESAFVYRIT